MIDVAGGRCEACIGTKIQARDQRRPEILHITAIGFILIKGQAIDVVLRVRISRQFDGRGDVRNGASEQKVE